jgi:hypothetical protein
MMSVLEAAGARERPSGNARLRANHQRELLERAAADGLTQEAIEAIRSTTGWQRWLGVRCYLSNLALHNQLLIAHQRPGARSVASSRGWSALGYEVRSGEKPIRVWAHVPPAKSALREWEQAGSPPQEKPEGELRLVPVFDQDQVSPQRDLPEPEEREPLSPSSDTSNLICLLGQLIKFASEIGAPVNFEPIAGVVRGYHEPGTGEIVIDASPDFPPAARANRLIYELANVLIDEDPRRPGLKLCNGEREVVARSVAWCVSSCAGRAYDETITVPAQWAADGGVVAVRYAALVDRVAGRLEGALLSGLDGEGE